MSFPTTHKILRAASFRLTLTYAALFVAGTLALLFAGGLAVIWVLDGELEDEVREEVAALEAHYRDDGLSALQAEIDERAEESLESGLFYGLTSGALGTEDRTLLAGNLPLLVTQLPRKFRCEGLHGDAQLVVRFRLRFRLPLPEAIDGLLIA